MIHTLALLAHLALLSAASLPFHHLERLFLTLPSRELAREHLRQLTSVAHMAGTPGDKQTAEYVLHKFKEYGFDAHIQTFRALLAYPVEASLKITAPPAFQYAAQLSEDILPQDPTSDNWLRSHPFNGYSPSARVSGQLVYVNYGREEDFQYLVQNLSISLEGKIALARYGQNYRGIKVHNAQLHGMIGCILYSDPFDDGFVKGKVYPEGPWRPPSGIQRGAVDTGSYCTGDPGFVDRDPEICGMGQDKLLPQIPVLPISYRDARHFLKALDGVNAPLSWRGGLDLPYNIGTGPAVVELYTNNSFQIRELWNVIAEIPGTMYPEEIILIGNHRDAWVFGAADPNSGTASMLDFAHSLSQLMAAGFRPQRTIKFCNWDGEEFNLIGSTYFGETFATQLSENAVVYMNMDTSVAGKQLSVSLTPSLSQFFSDITTKICTPDNVSLYDSWDKRVGVLGAGSDYTVFLDHLGIASTDFSFGGSYGVYHSVYDSFHWMDTEGDPGFFYHQLTSQLIGLMTLRFSESLFLPFNYSTYAFFLNSAVDFVDELGKSAQISLDVALLRKSVLCIETASQAIEQAKFLASSRKQINCINRALFLAERQFLLAEGVPGRPWFKHVVQSPGLDQGYDAVVLSSIIDAIRQGNSTVAQQQASIVSELFINVSEVLTNAALFCSGKNTD